MLKRLVNIGSNYRCLLIRKETAIRRGLFHYAQEFFRGNNFQKPEPLLKRSAFFSVPVHQIKQIIIAADEIVGLHFNGEVQLRLVFGIAWIGEMFRHRPQITAFVRQKLDERSHDFIRDVFVLLAKV